MKEGVVYGMDVIERFKRMEVTFGRLGHLAGYVAAISERCSQSTLTAIALEALADEFQGDGEDMGDVAGILRQAAADERAAAEASKTAAEGVATAINSALSRLSDNATLTPEDVAAIKTDLEAAKAASDAATAAAGGAAGVADTIDPDVATGGVVVDPDTEGGVVDTTPPPA